MASNIRIKDLPTVTTAVSSDKVLIDGTTTRSITVQNLLATIGGSGDFSSNTATSVDGEMVLFGGTAGKTGKRSTLTGGLLKSTSGVPAIATAGTDYLAPAAIGVSVQAYDAQLSSLIRQNSQSAAYTTVLSDGGKHLLHPAADTTARTFTIDSNANVAYPIGTPLTFINQNGGGVITIAITSDTMRLAGAGTTGSRTLAANGIATAV